MGLQNLAYLNADGKVVVVPAAQEGYNGPHMLGAMLPPASEAGLQNLAYLDANGNVVVVPAASNGSHMLGAQR